MEVLEVDQRMTELERLMELIETAVSIMQNTPEKLADYLLEHGVIVPPCKVGDTVYKVMDFKYTCAQMLEIKILRMEIQDEMRFYAKTVKHHRYNYIWFDSADIGKTVFFTREEAEDALAERRNAK